MTTSPYLVHHLLEPRESDANKVALIDGSRSISYQTFSQLAARCAAPIDATLAELLELELAGWIARLPGPVYCRRA